MVKVRLSKGLRIFSDELFTRFPESDIYLVGGALRDMILGRGKEVDYDFVVRGVPLDKLEKFLKGLGKVNLVGKNFSVLKFKPKGRKTAYDIALPRTEHSIAMSGKRRDFNVFGDPQLSIEKDLSRRDFTINALAFSLRTGELIDPFEGLDDIKKGKIKAVGDPNKRFKEDYSRVLRALRFACQLDFKIDKKTLNAIKELISYVVSVPKEIIAQELLKSFVSNPVKAFDLYEESGAFATLIPEVIELKGCEQPVRWHTEGDAFEHTRLALKMLGSKTFERYFPLSLDSETVLAVLFHDLGKPPTREKVKGQVSFYTHEKVGAQIAKRICRRLKLSSPKNLGVKCESLCWLVKNHFVITPADPDQLRATTIEKYFFNSNYPGETLLKLILVDRLSAIPESGKPDLTHFKSLIKRLRSMETAKRELPTPLLSGDEIIDILKISPGPKVGEIKRALREEQLSRRIGNKGEAKDYLRKLSKKLF